MKVAGILFMILMATYTPTHAQKLIFPDNLNTPHTTGKVTSDNIKIHYEIHGKGTPLILLHGGMGYSGHWGYQIKALKKHYRVIAIDTRGHGYSRFRSITQYRQAEFSYDAMAKDVLAVMDQLSINKAPMLGWSDGANTALTIAIKYPGRISAALLYAANYNPSGTRRARDYTYFNQYLKHCETVAIRWPEKYFARALRNAQKNMWRTQPKFTDQHLRTTKIPVAVISGNYDEIIKSSHTEKMARLIPNSKRITIWDATHFAHLQKPEKFNQIILEYLKSVK